MQYIVTEEDKSLVLQNNQDYRVRISILSQDGYIIGMLTGCSSIGDFNIDSESDVRRTASVDIKLDDFYYDIEKKIETYLNLDFDFEIGILNKRNDEYKYYRMGRFCMTETNTSYDVSTNTLSLSLTDFFSKLNGTRNGQIGGAPTIIIPVEYEDTKNTIKNAVITVIQSETNIENYIIDDIGEYYGMPQNNPDYISYRELNEDWNIIPYDLEFSVGDTVSSMLIEVRDLYPNCQLYFDIYGNLCFDMIPSNNKYPIVLDDEYIQKVILSDGAENVQYDIQSIKNVVEVWGQTYDIDRYCETVSTSSNIYNLTLESYTSYTSYQMIAFKASSNNLSNMYININNISNIPLYYEYTTNFISKDTISEGDTSVIRIMKNNGDYVAYYLGEYQPHALCVLTNDINDEVYTKDYFAEKYNCDKKNIAFIEADSPFSIQKIGIVFDCKSGDDYDNILSNSVALDNAKYCIYKSSVWNDTVTIKTKLLPWLDVNTKISYKKQQDNEVHEYLIKKIVHSFNENTTSITMYRFSSLYQE